MYLVRLYLYHIYLCYIVKYKYYVISQKVRKQLNRIVNSIYVL